MRIAAALALLFGLAPVADPAGGAVYPSSEQTRAEFDSHCRRLTEGENEYFGEALVGQLEARLEPVDGVGLDPLSELLIRGRLSAELIRVGRQEDAIVVLERARALLQAHDLDPDGSLEPRLLANLALAHLQLGERRNCVERHSAESCILPISPEAVHRLAEPARRAGDLFAELAALRPEAPEVRWLLNVARMTSGDYPQGVPPALRLPDSIFTSGPSMPAWRNRAAELGVDAFDLAGGAIMDDFDGDGLLDLVSSSWHPCDPLKAYRNRGPLGFEEVAAAWGLDGQLGGLNLTHADFDGDGRLDILVLRGAWMGESGRIRNSLLWNRIGESENRFVDISAAAGLAYPAYPTQNAAWADYDGDGDLDVYIGNEATGSSTDPLQLFGNTGNPYPSQLFRNDGDRTFTDVARVAGVANRRFAKGSAWGDYDDDGDPDLYVSNIGPNRLYRNEGDGTFTDVAEELQVTEPSDGSFATWFFDYDNDGDLDLLVGGYSTPTAEVFAGYLGSGTDDGHPILYRNEGDGSFLDVSERAGLAQALLVMGANYGDLDNDGWLDFYLGTGVPNFEALMPNVMYRNRGGLTFEDVTFSGGFGHLQKGHAVAFGDLDNDGDQDLFEQMGGAYPYDAYGNALYENPGNTGRWLVLRLGSEGANRYAVGARIAIDVRSPGGRRTIHHLVGSGGSFGGSSYQAEIGLGDAEAIEAVRIRWPGSREEQTISGLAPDGFYEILEGRDTAVEITPPTFELKARSGAAAKHERPSP